MFGLLKAKLSGFVNNLIGREEKKKEEPAEISTSSAQAISEEGKIEEKKAPIIAQKKSEPKPEIKIEQKPAIKPEPVSEPEPKPQIKIEQKPKSAPAQIAPESKPEAEKTGPKPQVKSEPPPQAQPEPVFIPKPEPKKGFISSIWPFAKKEEQKPQEKKTIQPEPAAEKQEPAFVQPKQEAESKKPSASKPEPKKPESAKPAESVPSPSTPLSSAQPLDSKELERLGRKALSDDEREMKVKLGVGKSITSIFTGQVTITEDDVRDLIDDLELSLLESDVAYDVSLEVAASLKRQLVGMKVPKGKMHEKVSETLQSVLSSIMTSNSYFDFYERVASLPKPAKILFIGPNGAGKTTTMAKLAHQLKKRGLTCAISASDTFRAAAIEQAQAHASRLEVPLIKSAYGSDPASVAFDAIKYAKSHQIDVVLIDSAGRQDTNLNLIDELKKINRVIRPDLKIYIGESIGGNALVEQVCGFHKAICIDGAILTKLDCDAKGGTAISLSRATGVPILFLGTGQGYDDLVAFDANEIARRILA